MGRGKVRWLRSDDVDAMLAGTAAATVAPVTGAKMTETDAASWTQALQAPQAHIYAETSASFWKST